jgi:hypothetical protein
MAFSPAIQRFFARRTDSKASTGRRPSPGQGSEQAFAVAPPQVVSDKAERLLVVPLRAGPLWQR